MRSSIAARTTVVAAFIACLLLALPAGAGAAKYPPDVASRGFNGGTAGWTPSSSTEGVCLAPLLCAGVENSFQATGGADGGGFVRSAYTGVVGAMALAGTTTGVWQSPAFTYSGAGAEDANSVTFALDRRASVDQLLAVSGNSAEYAVRLIDLSEGGEAQNLIGPTTLAGAGSWTNVQTSVDPGKIVDGHEYRIQIESRYTSGTSVLVSGSADYDNVVLTALNREAGGNGKGKGGKGGNGKGGGALSSDRLEDLLRQATPATATVSGGGKRLLVRVKCPHRIGHTCRIAAQGLLRKRPATAKRTVRLRSGKSRLLSLKVKPKARKQVAKRKRLLVREKVRAGKVSATVTKSRRLIRRG
jgi:hypothetical protein